MNGRILIIDDERGIRLTFESFLSDEGYEVHTAESFAEATAKLASGRFDLVFADIVLGSHSGIDILQLVKKSDANCPVVMITGFPNVETASEAVRLGAFDYLPKPVVQDTLLRVTRQALRHRALVDEKERYRSNLQAIFESVGEAIIGTDRDLVIAAVNEAARDMCGLTAGSVGRRLSDQEDPCEGKCFALLSEAIEHKRSLRANRIECRRQDRSSKVVSVAASPVIDESGQSAGGVLVIRDETRIEDLERELSKRDRFFRLVGKSERMQRIYTLIEALSDFESTVLVTGESGTGKELVAEALHYTGARRDKPLVKVNCSALSENLLESELFGHVRGAFTGALRDRKGRFEEADGGTIFLDEIGDISPRMQAGLLRVLQEREFERVGDSRSVKVDVRVIAATNRDLRERIRDGRFREDLYYRLKVVELHMPPLRERREDIPLLVNHFMTKIKGKLHKEIRGLSAEVDEVFMAYPWPGNVRELEHVLEHAFFMCRHDVVTLDDLPADFREAPGAAGRVAQHAICSGEVGPEDILKALEKAAWNKARASVLLGMSRSTLYRKIQEYKISAEDPLKKR